MCLKLRLEREDETALSDSAYSVIWRLVSELSPSLQWPRVTFDPALPYYSEAVHRFSRRDWSSCRSRDKSK